MAIRVPPPTEPHNDTTARFKRSMADAFPVGTRDLEIQARFPTPNRPGAWLISALVVLVALALAGCSGAEAQERGPSAADLKRAAAGAWNCPGMHAEWIDETTVECLKEKP